MGLAPVRAEAPARPSLPRMAVLPLKGEGLTDLGDVSDTLNNVVTSSLLDSGAFQLVERNQIQSVLKEAKFQHSGLVDEETLSAMGKCLGVGYVLVGSYLTERNPRTKDLVVTMSLRIVDVEKALVYKSFMDVAEGPTLGAVITKLNTSLAEKTSTIRPGDVTGQARPGIRKVLLILRQGAVTCAMKGQTHAEPSSLAFFNEKLEDYDFLLTGIARLFPPDVKVLFQTQGFPGKPLDQGLDGIVQVILDRTGKIHTFTQEAEHRVEVRVEFTDTRNQSVVGVRTVATDQIKGKLYEVMPMIKEQLSARIERDIAPLPFTF
jgi:hypothetical protein